MFPRLLLYLLSIRIKQLFRLFSGIDFIRLFFLLAIVVLAGYMLLQWSSNEEYTKAWIIVHSLIFIFIHLSRSDKKFIKLITPWPALLFFVEYLFLSLPFLVIFVIHHNWPGLLLIPMLLLISFVDLHLRFNYQGLMRILPAYSKSRIFTMPGTGNPYLFEWNSSLRVYLPFIGFIYLVIVCFSFTGYVSHIGIILLSVLISTFYFQGESRIFIEQFSSSPKKFLVRKIALNIRYLTIIYLPIITISLVFQTEMWYLLLLALCISYAIQVLIIVIKYSLFRENSNLERNSLIHIISVICLLLPFIWPLPVFIGIRSYRKAIKNLYPYFHDQD